MNNFKITKKNDLLMLKKYMDIKTRNGIGFDVHRTRSK